jgi:arylsulfatase A-like enzyme
MYDSLNRRYLPNYGDSVTIAPNFTRLGERCATFDNFYAGSLPCMPARRELHTGRYNFLHRSWGPLEPFDRSMPQMLSDAGVYTHCVTDHAHYWQDGGEAYLQRFSSNDMIRGQEGDFWRGRADGFAGNNTDVHRQDAINRQYQEDESEHPHAKTNAAALRFLEDNVGADNWFLQIEHFDPHEPFFAPQRFRDLYGAYEARDWPNYAAAGTDADAPDQAQRNYRAILTMCDEYLGRILDFMDSHDMWKDTMLIVNTDHGFLLGEHGYFGKNYMPIYDELAHTPFFAWDPRAGCAGVRRSSLAQTIDIAPTLLEYFSVARPPEMLGKPLRGAIAADELVRESALFGYFGKHVNVTDGQYVYMRGGRKPGDGMLNEYTVMPQHLFCPFSLEELRGTARELTDAFSFTRGVPVMKIPTSEKIAPGNSAYKYDEHLRHGDLLFDMLADPGQLAPLRDPALEERMIRVMRELLLENEAPAELYDRMGM